MSLSPTRPSWPVDGRDWPNRDYSRFVRSGGLSWHVQEMGEGPRLLLLHGTGAATHSFRDLLPALARSFHVLALDLPGHGFTSMPPGSGLRLDGMARLVAGVLTRAQFRPDLAVGHSAGAAILVAMALSGLIEPKAIIALNGALRPMQGASLFSPMAKLLFVNPFAPKLFAWRAKSDGATRQLLESTGSAIDPRGIELYERLFRRSGHVAGTLGMMANWDLGPLGPAMVGLRTPLILVTAPNDRAIPPSDAAAIKASVASARILALESGGHLVHEEQPEHLAALIGDVARDVGLA